MIRIDRGLEPTALTKVRQTELPRVREIATRGAPTSEQIVGYDVGKELLWQRQHAKCCYCETREQLGYNDVEHFRPKASAQRLPGSTLEHGYWWLAWSWDNLLFSCMNCNRGKGKGTQFPLAVGSQPLLAEQVAPAGEQPLLVDPSSESGVKHIKFVLTKHGTGLEDVWTPLPRNGSPQGEATIRVCRLDRGELVDLYTRHVRREVWPEAELVHAAIESGSRENVLVSWRRASFRLLVSEQPYVDLAYDALNHFVKKSTLAPFGLQWKVISLKRRADEQHHTTPMTPETA